MYDININEIITSYFNMHFKQKKLLNKFIPDRLRHLSLKKIYVSKPEIKHTSDKAIITLYVYNNIYYTFLRRKKKLTNLINTFRNLYNYNIAETTETFLNKQFNQITPCVIKIAYFDTLPIPPKDVPQTFIPL